MQFAPLEAELIVSSTLRRAFGDLATASKVVSPESIAPALSALGIFAESVDDDPAALGRMRTAHLVALEAGRAALPYPILERLVARTGGLVFAGDNRARDDGNVTAASAPSGRARASLRDGKLYGTVGVVAFPTDVTLVLAIVRDDHAGRDSVALVNAHGPDAHLRPRRSAEWAYPLADLVAEGAPIAGGQAASSPDDGAAAAQRLELVAAVLAAAEMCGAATAAMELTKRHLETRTQFGAPLSANQALRHTMATNHVRAEAMTAATRYAALALDADAEDGEVAARAAKHYASIAGRALAEDMLQLHGAIGFTVEYPLGRYACRLLRLAAMHGTPLRQAERLLDLLASSPDA